MGFTVTHFWILFVSICCICVHVRSQLSFECVRMTTRSLTINNLEEQRFEVNHDFNNSDPRRRCIPQHALAQSGKKYRCKADELSYYVQAAPGGWPFFNVVNACFRMKHVAQFTVNGLYTVDIARNLQTRIRTYCVTNEQVPYVTERATFDFVRHANIRGRSHIVFHTLRLEVCNVLPVPPPLSAEGPPISTTMKLKMKEAGAPARAIDEAPNL